jgi:hypothetical protein
VCEEIGCILPWFNFCSPINRGSQSCWFSVDSEAILKSILFWYQNRPRIKTSELTPESVISILDPNENRLQLDTGLRSGPELKSELITESTRNSILWLPLMITRKCQLGQLPCCSHPGVRTQSHIEPEKPGHATPCGAKLESRYEELQVHIKHTTQTQQWKMERVVS